MATLYYESQICHHGILGMKWGRRRYQNRDGSLTPLGEKRRQKEIDKIVSKERTEQRKIAMEQLRVQEARKTAEARKKLYEEKKGLSSAESRPKHKSASEMSDEELNSFIKRADLEKRYNELVNPVTPKKEHKIMKAIAPALATAATKALTDFASKEITNLLSNALSDSKDDKKSKKEAAEKKAKEEREASEKKAKEEREASEKKAKEEREASEKKAKEEREAAREAAKDKVDAEKRAVSAVETAIKAANFRKDNPNFKWEDVYNNLGEDFANAMNTLVSETDKKKDKDD